MTADRILVGEIAHIESPVPDGPRFRASMTNEERRHFDNLLLLCATHHKVVDRDLDTWTVERLQRLKGEHEAIYTAAIEQLRATVVGDVTEGTDWLPPANLRRLTHGDQRSTEDLVAEIEVLSEIAKRLASIPVTARSVLALIVNRGQTRGWSSPYEISIPAYFLEEIADCSRDELYRQTNILEHAGFLILDEPYEEPPEFAVTSTPREIDWPFLADLKEIAGDDATLIRHVLVQLDFTALDE